MTVGTLARARPHALRHRTAVESDEQAPAVPLHRGDDGAALVGSARQNGDVRRQDLSPAQRQELFDEQVVPYMSKLYGTALHYTRNHADAQDVLQETLAKAYTALHQFQPGTNLQAWLHRILRTTHINMIRKRKRRPAEADGEILDEVIPGTRSVTSAEQEVIEATLDPELKEAFWDLPPAFRHVVYMVDVEGYAYKEVAASMGIPLGTVMLRLHRARRLLRQRLEGLDSAGDGPPERRGQAA